MAICIVFLAERMIRELSCRTSGGPQNIIFQSEVQATRMYCGRPLFLRSEASRKRPYSISEQWGERTPWSKEHLVASAIWRREDPPFSGHCLHGQPILHPLLQVWYYVVLTVVGTWLCHFPRSLFSHVFKNVPFA